MPWRCVRPQRGNAWQWERCPCLVVACYAIAWHACLSCLFLSLTMIARLSSPPPLCPVQLIMAMEEAFGVEIPDEEAEKLTTPQQCVDLISAKQ